MESGIDTIRRIARRFAYVREGFNQRYTLAQLVKIDAAWSASPWDIFPDEWTDGQIRDALRGFAPDWDSEGNPIAGRKIQKP